MKRERNIAKPKHRYPGQLNEPIRVPPFTVGTSASAGLLTLEWFSQFKQAEEEKLFLLLAHYNIPKNSPNCWRKLVTKLAHAHVPGFRIARSEGRPRIHKPKPKDNGKRGRPREVTDDFCRLFVRFVDHYKQEHNITTDKAALKAMILVTAKELNKSSVSAVSKKLKYNQKLLSSCRKKFQ